MTEQMKYRRWYDKDPILSKSMKILETSDDEFQIKMAINLVKIIIEHNIEEESFKSIDDIMGAVEEGRIEKGNTRWYDLDKTVQTAMQMLENCSNEAQSVIAQQMAHMVAEKVNEVGQPNEAEIEE